MTRGLFAAVLVLAAAPAAAQTVHEVGPGRTYERIADVALGSLGPGDEVRIHWRAEPYRETFGLDVTGTAEAPIVIRGVAGPEGQRPVIDGEDANEGPDAQRRGVVSVNGGAHLTIEGLEIRNGHTDYGYLQNTASVFVPAGSHITLRDLDVHHSGNGIFSWIDSSDVLVERCFIHDNGNVGSNFEHNVYTESRRITFQYNHLAPLRPGATGNNLKDRSEGTVIRYNWIEGGNRPLDLVEAEDLSPYDGSIPTFVYGNVLIKLEDTGQDQVVHCGQDVGLAPRTLLYFVHNSIYSTRSGTTDVLFLNADATAYVANNIIHHTGTRMRLVDPDSNDVTVELGPNWITSGWERGHGGATFNGESALIEGSDPGYSDAPADLTLTASSPARDQAGPLPSGAEPVTMEYRPGGGVARGSDGMPDLGAFERCEAGCVPVTIPDAGVDRSDGGSTSTSDGGTGGSAGGCSCRAGAPGGSPARAVGILTMAVLLLRRRR